jgi:hypothetical protein
MQDITLTTREALLYGALLNAGIGLLVGLAPLVLGFMRDRKKLGILGMAASIIGGAILGLLLSIPAAGLFVWLIVQGTNPAERHGPPAEGE